MLGCAVVAIFAAPLRAEIEDAGFSLTISEKEMALNDSIDLMTMKYLMWDLSFDRIMARNMPYVEVRNNSDSDAPLTEFRMTIGDEKFHFNCEFMGECAMLGKTTPGFDLNSFTEDGGDLLVVQFGNGGIAPGEFVRFKIDVDPDSQYQGQIYTNPDFRTVLFDMNGRNVYGNDPENDPNNSSADNASFWGKFEMAGMDPLETEEMFLDDRNVGGAPGLYYNQIRRPYGVMEDVDQFRFLTAAGGGPDPEIPEPGTVALAALGLLGGLAATRTRGKRC
jgi:hypothetical protein